MMKWFDQTPRVGLRDSPRSPTPFFLEPPSASGEAGLVEIDDHD
jgi:hypothetical protein